MNKTTTKSRRLLTIAAANLVLFGFTSIASAGAACGPATWSSHTATSAVGLLDGITISVTSSTTAPIIGLGANRFGVGGPGLCGGWDGTMALGHDAVGVIATQVSAGDYQIFDFSSALSDGLFYIENFDANSIANITAVGATGISLVDYSSSISYASTGADSGTLVTSNMGSNGEGDAVLQFTGDVTSIRIDYTSGGAGNGVFYTFAKPCAVPEPTSALVMAGLFGIGGLFIKRRRK